MEFRGHASAGSSFSLLSRLALVWYKSGKTHTCNAPYRNVVLRSNLIGASLRIEGRRGGGESGRYTKTDPIRRIPLASGSLNGLCFGCLRICHKAFARREKGSKQNDGERLEKGVGTTADWWERGGAVD